MTRAKQAVSMKDARVLKTEVLVPTPKRFVRELVEMPDGYRCDWYFTDTPPSVMIVPSPPTGTSSSSASTGTTSSPISSNSPPEPSTIKRNPKPRRSAN